MKKAANARNPISTRLLNWWQGSSTRRATRPQEVVLEQDPAADGGDGSFPWTAARIALNHRIWGPGFMGPGGPDLTLEFVRPAAVDASQSMLDFNSGLGGPAAVVAKSYQMYVDGQEQAEILVDEGMRVAKHYHVGERVKILDFNPDEFELGEKKYFCVLSREYFYRMEDKEAAIEKIYKSLKEVGSFIFTDYIVSETITPNAPGLAEWRKVEPEAIFPWRPSQYRDLLKKMEFELRIFGDETERFRQMVLNALQTFVATLSESPISEEQTDILMRETQIWRGRIKALESGDVKLLRVHAVRKRQLF